MEHRKIIGEAWEFTQNNKPIIRWYAFLPSLIATCYGILYLIYQFYAFKSSRLFENWGRSFTMIALTDAWQTLRDNFSVLWPFLVVAIVVVVLYFFLPPVTEGAIIQMTARKKNNIPVRTAEGLKYGFWTFLPMFEYTTMVRTFSVASMLGWASFIMRNLGWQAFVTFLPIFIIYGIAVIFMTILFTYTEFFIVIDDLKMLESITKSCLLVIRHLQETVLLSILMLIISVRIVLQLLFVVLIPVAMFAIVYFFTLANMEVAGIAVGSVLSAILLYIAAYLGSTIQVFSSAVWTFTFLELTGTPEIDARGRIIKEKEKVKKLEERLDKLEEKQD